MRFRPCGCLGMRPEELPWCVECSETIVASRRLAKRFPRYVRKYLRWKEGADRQVFLLSLLCPRVYPPLRDRHKAVSSRSGRKWIEIGGRFYDIEEVLHPPQKVLLPIEERRRAAGDSLVRVRGTKRFRHLLEPLPGWALMYTWDAKLMGKSYALTYAKAWALSAGVLRAKMITEVL